MNRNFKIVVFILFVLIYQIEKDSYAQQNLPPRNLYVDTLTNIAYWDPPPVVALPLETFEDEIFPPTGWSDFSMCDTGWYRTDSVKVGSLIIPSFDGYFAATDGKDVACDPTQDFLYFPDTDLSGADDYILEFDYVYSYAFGQQAYVCYSSDSVSWEIFESLSPIGSWAHGSVSLSTFSGPDKPDVWFSFWSTCYYPYFGSGFAIDNVTITGGETEVEGYHILLDGVLIDSVSSTQNYYQFDGLEEGQLYEVCVKAVYDSSISESICTEWTYWLINSSFEQSRKVDINIYPVPMTNYVFIEGNSPINSVRILNLQGQTIMKEDDIHSKTVRINTIDQPPGVYTMEIETDKKTFLKKIIIYR